MTKTVSSQFCPRVETRFLDKPLVRIRYLRTVRLPERERKSLGLQKGVGYTEQEIDRARFYRAMEQVIIRELLQAQLTPLEEIGFDGRAPRIEYHPLPGENPNRKYPRNVNASPLDYLFFRSKKPIPLWQWATGKRFEYDYRRSRTDAPVTVDLGSLDLFTTPAAKAEARKRQKTVTTFPRRAGRRTISPPALDDSRLDAMARLGRLAAEISRMSFWLLEHAIGQEWTLREIAERLGTDERYIAERFREALTEAAAFYRLAPSLTRVRPRQKSR